MRRFFQTTSTKSLLVTCFLSFFFFFKVQVKPPPSSLPLARHTFFTVSFEGKYGSANECERCDNHHVTRDWDKEEIVSPPHDSKLFEVIDLDSGFHAAESRDTGFRIFLSVKLGFWIPVVTEIPDSFSCIPDSKAKDSGFQKQNFPGIRNSLHGEIQAAVNVDGCLYTRNILMYYRKLWWNLFYSWIFFFQRVWTYQALTRYKM